MLIEPGMPAPWFVAPSTSNPRFVFDTVAGRYVVLCFLGSAADRYSRDVVDAYLRARDRFDDENACFFGVSTDPADLSEARLRQVLPGYRFFWDFRRELSRLYGLAADDEPCRRYSFVLDPRLRVLAAIPWDAACSADEHVGQVLLVLDRQPRIGSDPNGVDHPPVLIVPRIFEPELCSELIDYFRRSQPQRSGFMRERDGKTVAVFDDSFKRRHDVSVADEGLRATCRGRIVQRLKPEVYKAFQFTATHAERYIVSRYDGAETGFFKAHRDNTTKGTAHRRFAVTINLNTGDYDGGGLMFPEFGRETYVAPLGGAVVFSCSLLHEALPVLRGTRYAFLPFLYDDEAARLRETNLRFVED